VDRSSFKIHVVTPGHTLRVVRTALPVLLLAAGCSATQSPSDGVNCATTLDDAGFSSLADLPLADLCARVAGMDNGSLTESTPCTGFKTVVLDDASDCSYFWLFDATSGLLVADGGGCDIYSSCNARPGVRFAMLCTSPPPPGTATDLCASSGASDAGGG
jgi:hypothetical protein